MPSALCEQFAAESGARVRIYRLKNLFGKWCRPNYNSVVATFCHNIAHDLPIDISDPATGIELTHVDDVVEAFLAELDGTATDLEAGGGIRSRRITLAELAAQIHVFHAMRITLLLPGLQCWFDRALYATYLSHVPAEAREHPLLAHQDARGSLAEFLKQDCFGQIFVSRTRPGVTRGNHYHHGKSEKFLVLEGSALIRMRDIHGEAIQEYRVTGERYQVIDIPPGFAHSIANVGAGDLVTLFWASEIFDQERPDTYPFPVGLEPASPEPVVPEPIVVESV